MDFCISAHQFRKDTAHIMYDGSFPKNAPVRIPKGPSYNCLTSQDPKISRTFIWSRQNVPLPHTTHSIIVCFECLLCIESTFPTLAMPRPKPDHIFRTFSGTRGHFPNFLAVPRHVRLKISPHAVAGLHQPPQKKSFGENYMQGQSFLQSPRAPHQSLGVLFRYLVSGSGRGGARFFSHHPRGWRSTTAKLTWGHLCPRLPSGPPRMSSWNLNQNT